MVSQRGIPRFFGGCCIRTDHVANCKTKHLAYKVSIVHFNRLNKRVAIGDRALNSLQYCARLTPYPSICANHPPPLNPPTHPNLRTSTDAVHFNTARCHILNKNEAVTQHTDATYSRTTTAKAVPFQQATDHLRHFEVLPPDSQTKKTQVQHSLIQSPLSTKASSISHGGALLSTGLSTGQQVESGFDFNSHEPAQPSLENNQK